MISLFADPIIEKLAYLMNFSPKNIIFNQLSNDWNICIDWKEVRPGSRWQNSARICAKYFVNPPNPNLLIHGGENV
jgi:hypothetical protein